MINISSYLEQQRRHYFLWVPVCFAIGIAVYFAIWFEPSFDQLILLGIVNIISIFLCAKMSLTTKILVFVIATISIGFTYASIATYQMRAPVLEEFYYGPIEGTLIMLDRSASNAPRAMLEDVYLPSIAAEKTPKRIRISLQGYIPENTLIAGQRIAMTGVLSPPNAPVEPYGFDFRRMAWFMQLGAVGYSRNPVLPAQPNNKNTFETVIFGMRMAVSNYIQSNISGQRGAFASAILTGDRSQIDPVIIEKLRKSNLAHLLAISGLHMGLLAGFIFGLVRYGLALMPIISLRVHAKKIAAAIALFIGGGYLLLSGSNIATQRAFIMAAVMLFAVIIDRPAFSLRSIALAALIILIVKPYSLLEAGFQMSFAATTALIMTYSWLQRQAFWQNLGISKFAFLRPVFIVMITSFIAGVATAPFSAFHFNQLSQYGLIANVLAVPVMGLFVMPSAIIAGILAPFGLANIAFYITDISIAYILWVATFFAELDGATYSIKSGPTAALAMISFGMVFFTLWIGRLRYLGLLVILFGIIAWTLHKRPEILVAQDGRQIGILTQQGRAISRKTGNGYTVNIWLENDGDPVEQTTAFQREFFATQDNLIFAQISYQWRMVIYLGKDVNDVENECTEKTIMIAPNITINEPKCFLINDTYLERKGALSIRMENNMPIITGSKDIASNRPWGY